MDQAEQLQPALFELDEDCALLFSRDEAEKRYTAEQAKNLEWKREAIILLIASDWPVETISTRLHVSTRTVRAIAAANAGKVAGSSKMFARICQGLGARWLGLAKTKEQEASFLQLVTAAAIATDKAIVLDSMGQLADVAETKEAPDRAAAMAALRSMMAGQVVDQAPGTDGQSDAPSHAIKALVVSDAPHDAPGTLQQPPQDPTMAPPAGQGGEGVSHPGRPPDGPMPQLPTDLQPKGPLGETEAK